MPDSQKFDNFPENQAQVMSAYDLNQFMSSSRIKVMNIPFRVPN